MVKQQKIEAGTAEITTVSGEGTVTVTFDQVFDYAPTVVVSLAEDPGAAKRGLVWVHTITTIDCIIEIDSDVTNETYTFNWIAMERRSSEKASQWTHP